MKIDLDWSNHGLANFWTMYGDLTILISGAALMALLMWAAYRLYRTEDKSKSVATIAAVFAMAWTGYGLVHVALTVWHVPAAFALPSFLVYEVLLIAAGLKAEENRRIKGAPGAAGRYTFLIAVSQGIVGASGAVNIGEAFMRFTLPLLAVGLWYVLLVSERESDKPEWVQARKDRAAAREATWVWTPTTVLVRCGIKRPGEMTQTQAERAAQIKRMVALADTIAILNDVTVDDRSRRQRRKLDKARTKLRISARTADEAMVIEVGDKALRAANAEALMVPGAGEPPAARWANDLTRDRRRRPVPPADTDRDLDQANDDDDAAPSSGAPAGTRAEPIPTLVDAKTWEEHRGRIELVMAEVGDAWYSGRPLSVDAIQAIGKDLGSRGDDTRGLASRPNAGATAKCLRLARYARLYPAHFQTLKAQHPSLAIPPFVTEQ